VKLYKFIFSVPQFYGLVKRFLYQPNNVVSHILQDRQTFIFILYSIDLVAEVINYVD